LLLLDENVPKPITDALNALGVAATHLLDRLKAGADDFEVIALAQSLGAIIVTLDTDFTTRKAWFLDMAARGVSVVVLRPRKGAHMDQLAEMILWHHRAWPGICSAGPVVISVKVPTQRARQMALIEFDRIEQDQPPPGTAVKGIVP
jgi:hypothetical protein